MTWLEDHERRSVDWDFEDSLGVLAIVLLVTVGILLWVAG